MTIPNGTDMNDGAASSDRGLAESVGTGHVGATALFVGSEWEGKGLRFALDALVHAPAWHLLVVGRGDRKRFEHYAESLGVRGRITFTGWVDDPKPFYRDATAFVLPSSYETFSLAAYEAAAAGLPLLVTAVHGVDEILRDGQNGWVIRQDGRDIAERLMKLGADPALRAKMGEAARKAVAGYSWGKMVREYSALYRSLS
jgi:glycosyltransferase involved in cell wall biosynthesis